MKLRAIAERLGCEVAGDANIEITGLAPIETAGPSELTFLANPKYASRVKQTRAAAILVMEAVRDLPIASVISSNPYLDFARALEFFYQPPRPKPGVHPTAVVAESASIGEDASIGAYAVVGENVVIGRNAVLHPHVVIYEGARIGDDFYAHSGATVREFCRIGSRVTLGNGVVIGGDGFGFAHYPDGAPYKIVQSGVVVIEDDVEIQQLSAIDRASMGETRVKRGAIVDNFVQVGHGCVVGENDILCAQVGLAGSSTLGRNVVLTGQVGVSGHLTIHDGVTVYAQSGIGGDIAAGRTVAGSPAFDAREWLRCVAAFPRLGEMTRTIRELSRKVEQLEKKLEKSNA